MADISVVVELSHLIVVLNRGENVTLITSSFISVEMFNVRDYCVDPSEQIGQDKRTVLLAKNGIDNHNCIRAVPQMAIEGELFNLACEVRRMFRMYQKVKAETAEEMGDQVANMVENHTRAIVQAVRYCPNCSDPKKNQEYIDECLAAYREAQKVLVEDLEARSVVG
jgi:hypothetical protein